MGTTLRPAPSKSYAFSTNYYACIALPTWRRCAPPICFYIDLQITCSRVVFTLDFLRRFSLMGTTLRAAPSKSYAFSTNYHAYIDHFLSWFSLMGTTLYAAPNNLYAISSNYMYILQCPHDIHVHLFCFDFHKFNLFLLRSRAATCPTSNCGRGTILFRQEFVYLYFNHFG